jgi:hypothetical protein
MRLEQLMHDVADNDLEALERLRLVVLDDCPRGINARVKWFVILVRRLASLRLRRRSRAARR